MSVEEQYRDDSNLRARIDLHARFSTAEENWFDWLWEREAPPPGSRLLEVGCGPAEMWKVWLGKIDPSVQVTLSDFSPGMIEAARRVVGDRAKYVVADVQELPFGDESFDVVIANHMLYHVSDRPKAYEEFVRVLAPGGVLHASTNGHGHMQEVQALAPGWAFSEHTTQFGLETGAEQLAAFFEDVTVERMDDALAITEVEPVLDYIRSSPMYEGQDLEPARGVVAKAIARDGAFHVTKTPGAITCRKP